MPESAERGWRVRSDTEAIPLRIDVAGRADLHLDVATAHWIVGAHDLAMALRALGQESEPEPMAKRRRKGNRGDVALIVGAGRFRAFGNEMGAGAQAILTIDRPETDESRPRRIDKRRPRCHEAADEV